MTAIVSIDDEVIGTEEFVRTLKLTGQFEGLIDQLVRDRLTVRAARKQRIPVSVEEIQERADQYRQIRALHRAADTNRYARFFHEMLNRNIYFAPSAFEAIFPSLAHTTAEIEETINAAAEAAEAVK